MKQRWSRREVSEVEYTVPLHTGSMPFLQIDSPAEVVILCRLTSSGLEPFRLCLSHQVTPRVVEEELKAGATQVVAIPARRDEYVSLVRSFRIADVREVEADLVAEPAQRAAEE
jgi:hypothetical protein